MGKEDHWPRPSPGKSYKSAELAPCEPWVVEALKPVTDQITKLQKEKPPSIVA